MKIPTIGGQNFPHVRVRLSPSATGQVWIDGKEVPNVERVTIRGTAGQPSEIELDLTCVEIDVEVGDREQPILEHSPQQQGEDRGG